MLSSNLKRTRIKRKQNPTKTICGKTSILFINLPLQNNLNNSHICNNQELTTLGSGNSNTAIQKDKNYKQNNKETKQQTTKKLTLKGKTTILNRIKNAKEFYHCINFEILVYKFCDNPKILLNSEKFRQAYTARQLCKNIFFLLNIIRKLNHIYDWCYIQKSFMDHFLHPGISIQQFLSFVGEIRHTRICLNNIKRTNKQDQILYPLKKDPKILDYFSHIKFSRLKYLILNNPQTQSIEALQWMDLKRIKVLSINQSKITQVKVLSKLNLPHLRLLQLGQNENQIRYMAQGMSRMRSSKRWSSVKFQQYNFFKWFDLNSEDCRYLLKIYWRKMQSRVKIVDKGPEDSLNNSKFYESLQKKYGNKLAFQQDEFLDQQEFAYQDRQYYTTEIEYD